MVTLEDWLLGRIEPVDDADLQRYCNVVRRQQRSVMKHLRIYEIKEDTTILGHVAYAGGSWYYETAYGEIETGFDGFDDAIEALIEDEGEG